MHCGTSVYCCENLKISHHIRLFMLFVQIPVMMMWKGREATEIIAWFQYEGDPKLNSNVFQVASYVVQKHFPGNCFPCNAEICTENMSRP
jgi:hypothetical protein